MDRESGERGIERGSLSFGAFDMRALLVPSSRNASPVVRQARTRPAVYFAFPPPTFAPRRSRSLREEP